MILFTSLVFFGTVLSIVVGWLNHEQREYAQAMDEFDEFIIRQREDYGNEG